MGKDRRTVTEALGEVLRRPPRTGVVVDTKDPVYEGAEKIGLKELLEGIDSKFQAYLEEQRRQKERMNPCYGCTLGTQADELVERVLGDRTY